MGSRNVFSLMFASFTGHCFETSVLWLVVRVLVFAVRHSTASEYATPDSSADEHMRSCQFWAIAHSVSRYCETVFQSAFTRWYFFVFLLLAILVGVTWYHIVVLFCTFLMNILSWAHFFVSIGYVNSLFNRFLLKSFTHFSVRSSVFSVQ